MHPELTQQRKAIMGWLPVALLALVFQLLAPAWASQAMQAMAMPGNGADPFADAPICSHEEPAASGDHKPGHPHAPECPACPACQVCCVGHVVVPPTPLTAPPRPVMAGFIQFDRWQPASPRGPPVVRARARSPPVFS